MNTLKEREIQACQIIDELAPRLKGLGAYLHAHPELGQEEDKAVAAIQEFLEDHHFKVQVGLTDRPELRTAMRAYGMSASTHPTSAGPSGGADHRLATDDGETLLRKIAFLGEYDALPGLGHGCGHNLIALMSLGATVAFDAVAPQGWAGEFLGCPAEETIGGKVYMSEAGLFKGYEAAMLIHPGGQNEVGGTSLATHPLEVTYTGRSAHVASLTDPGLNALDSAALLYLRIRDLKKDLPQGVRIGTIFTDGGQAPNVIPGQAQLHMTVRAKDVDTIENIVLPAIRQAAQEVAQEEGTQVAMRHYEPLFKDMRQDGRLLAIFQEVMTEFGEEPLLLPDDEADGSTDVGNVSYDVPTVQPTLNIGLGLEAHTPEFACAAGSDFGLEQAIKGAKILAVAALRYSAMQSE